MDQFSWPISVLCTSLIGKKIRTFCRGGDVGDWITRTIHTDWSVSIIGAFTLIPMEPPAPRILGVI